MSSPRSAPACDAVLHRDDHPIGPMRLPVIEPAEFIDEFNRVYASLGLNIQPLRKLTPGKLISETSPQINRETSI